MLTRKERRLFLVLTAAYVLIVALGTSSNENKLLGFRIPLYFSSKRNFVNKYFVKYAWAWYTLVFWTTALTRKFNIRRLGRSTANYFLSTIWWYIFTQWLFGPPLMDRIFTITGGSCVHDQKDLLLATSMACRRGGGLWHGGHDPSGHVFILVHSSLSLWIELLPDLRARTASWRNIIAPVLLLCLWVFMLSTTAVYFHTALEKITGLAFGCLVALITVYKFERFN